MDDAERPRLGALNVSDERRTHILDGDAHGAGGHRHGTGRPTKTEFPARWDDATVIQNVLDVSRRPDQPPRLQENGRWYAHGVRDGVDVVVAIEPSGGIVTSYPLEGGRGVVKNPRRGGR